MNYELIHKSAHSALRALEMSEEPTVNEVLSKNIEPVLQQNQKIIDALVENNKQLLKANEIKEKELEDAKKESISNRRWTIATFIVAVLSLVAAIITWFI